MKYLFILGRNPLLSIAEILSWLEARDISVLNNYGKNELLLLDLNKDVNCAEMMSWLGGCLKIGKVIISDKDAEYLFGRLDKLEIYFGEAEKFFYSILENVETNMSDYLKARFKKEKLKATPKNIGYKVRQQDGEYGGVSPKSSLRLGVEYFLIYDNKEYNFGIIQSVANTGENEKRDMSRPFRRSSLSISPRLAKILVNLAEVKENETLLDPFCGAGTILSEAMLNGVNVVGVDSDNEAIISARKNLSWFKKNYNIPMNAELINDNSSKIILRNKVDGIATEPLLGPLLKTIPRKEAAEKIAHDFENFMASSLLNLKQYVKKDRHIAFTMPLLQTGEGRIRCDIKKIASLAGLRIKNSFPIPETREHKIMSREFVVLKNEDK